MTLLLNSSHIFQVKVWNPETEECLHTLSGHTNRVYSLQFDGIHVVSGSLDTSIRVWDVETGNFFSEFYFKDIQFKKKSTKLKYLAQLK